MQHVDSDQWLSPGETHEIRNDGDVPLVVTAD
jgi:hypothetical protein